MSKKLRNVLLAVAIGLMIGGAIGQWGSTVWHWLPVVGPSGLVTQVTVVYESKDLLTKGNEWQTEVLHGRTSQALIKANGWDMIDKDHPPKGMESLVAAAVKSGLPYVYMFSTDGKMVKEGPLPKTDVELKAMGGL
jgi:hypothetical protein